MKITVVRRTDSKQIFGDKPPVGQVLEACSRFKEGQEFIVKEDGLMPEEFCTGLGTTSTKHHIEVWRQLLLDE